MCNILNTNRSTSTLTIMKPVLNLGNFRESKSTLVHIQEKTIDVQDDLDVSDQQANISKDDITFEGTDNDGDENKSIWAKESSQDGEMLVVVVEECHENDENLKLQTEEETISAASTPNAYGKREIDFIKSKVI